MPKIDILALDRFLESGIMDLILGKSVLQDPDMVGSG